MAIDPISTVMTMQAQPAKQVETREKKIVDKIENIVDLVENQTDNKTHTVKKSEEGHLEKQDNGNQPKRSLEQIKQSVERMNKQMNTSEALFGFHEDTNRVTIKIVDKETRELIKELPPEKSLDLIAKAWELAGLLVDEKR